jgi:hypothetical protein
MFVVSAQHRNHSMAKQGLQRIGIVLPSLGVRQVVANPI